MTSEADMQLSSHTSQPERIQLSRAKGWRKPPGVIVVSRPSKWGNPFKMRGTADMWVAYDDRTGKVVSFCNSRTEAQAAAVQAFTVDLVAGLLSPTVADVQRELAGKDLACFCPLDGPCHADVLIGLANADQAVGR